MGDERFRLAIAALSRDDVEEVRSLVDTCPRFDYRMKDWEYFERADAAVHIVMLLDLELAPRLYPIRFLDNQDRLAEFTFEWLEEQAALSWMAGFKHAGGDMKALEAVSDDPEAKDLERIFLEAEAGTQGITLHLRQFWSQVREKKRQAIATILAGFDAFTRDTWGIGAGEAIKVHSVMFEDLSPYLKEIGEVPVAEDTVKRNAASFKRLWRSLIPEAGST